MWWGDGGWWWEGEGGVLGVILVRVGWVGE